MVAHPLGWNHMQERLSSNGFCPFLSCIFANIQGRILAVRALAAKLPNSDLNFAVDFCVDCPPVFFFPKKARKKSQKIPRKITQDFVRKNPPRISAEAFSSQICQRIGRCALQEDLSSVLCKLVQVITLLVHLSSGNTNLWIGICSRSVSSETKKSLENTAFSSSLGL